MKKYVFKPYNDLFPELFELEKERIEAIVQAIAIEHIGSTAIPGLGGKGIIDIAIAVEKWEMEEVIQQLQSLGYEYRSTFSTPDRAYFIIYLSDPVEDKRRYHVHLTYPENKEWSEFLEFRDYLRSHHKEREEYAEMKRTAAEQADHDGEKYRELKGPMFKKILNKLNHP